MSGAQAVVVALLSLIFAQLIEIWLTLMSVDVHLAGILAK